MTAPRCPLRRSSCISSTQPCAPSPFCPVGVVTVLPLCRASLCLFACRYAGLFVASEVPLLVLVRFLAMRNGTPFFDASVSRLASGRARLCFIVVAAHVMQDFFVAAVRLEPNTGAG